MFLYVKVLDYIYLFIGLCERYCISICLIAYFVFDYEIIRTELDPEETESRFISSGHLQIICCERVGSIAFLHA